MGRAEQCDLPIEVTREWIPHACCDPVDDHYSADRNAVNKTAFLIESGADNEAIDDVRPDLRALPI